jgi:glycosidase
VVAALSGSACAPKSVPPAEARPADPWARTCPASDPAPPAPDAAWWREAVFYEVFVRSFADSDGDGVGDLAGLTARLDYLNDGDPATDDDLGVTALWLMPINESPSYHGYDVVDYRSIEKDYGTMEDWETLVREARARGIRVVMDLVLNHTSSAHPWFIDSRTGPDAEYRAWYVWSKEPRSWSRPWGPGPTWYRAGDAFYYALFWEGMPDLNYTTEAVRAEAVANALFWLDRGAAGFRLDAVRYLVETGPGEGQSDTPETHAFWRRLRREVAEKHPHALLVGEAWTDRPDVVPYHGQDDELHMTFDFDLSSNIGIALRMANPAAVRDSLCDALRRFPAYAQRGTFLSNHDMLRIASQLDRDPALLRQAAALLLTLPGTPFLYYGEEIGLPNGPQPNDEAKRQPMRWTDGPHAGFTTGLRPWQPPWSGDDAPSVAAQTDDPGSLLAYYRRLIGVRRAHSALREGRTEVLPPEPGADSLLALLRRAGDETVLVLHNFGREPLVDVTVRWDGRALAPAAVAGLETLFGEVGGAPRLASDGRALTLPRLDARAAAVLRLR